MDESRSDASLRIIADHARAATFLISDGVLPANEGRGYVLRKILRRGIRHGRLLGQEKPFMYQMVYAVRDEMRDAYPELKETADRVSKVVEAEERQFARAVSVGLARLESELAPLVGKPSSVYPGAAAFHLYETYGLPLDFMVDAARDAGIAFDMEGFEKARRKSRRVLALRGKAGRKATASPAIASCRRPSLRATASSSRTAAKCWRW